MSWRETLAPSVGEEEGWGGGRWTSEGPQIEIVISDEMAEINKLKKRIDKLETIMKVIEKSIPFGPTYVTR